ncbi:hypothetical protein [Oceanibacterium hippocampi]|uniref:Uncharacterized protein n=1 Tax=Oceanibacterium hippocampi TaxID=745714 RepID=A0A1Y5ST73_9PROT|nr:hypothetical protein [Oceanibacterium hippocampi]SLN47777.1 hypothetical protein OCH7691_02063 [Oceanibacterium hippocampi]
MKWDIRDKTTWSRVALIGTVLWLTYVTMETGGDLHHPLFDYVFIVPLALWIGVVIIKQVIDRTAPDRAGVPGDGPGEEGPGDGRP